MNPAIHHPHWYQMINAISSDEAGGAAKKDDMYCLPATAHFSVSRDLEISCEMDKWEIRTSSESETPRVLEMASRVFTVLDHTPVSAVGININFLRQTGIANVGSVLAHRLQPLDLFTEAEGEQSAGISIGRSTKGRKWTVWVLSVAEAASFVEVRTNAHYDSFNDLYGHHFDLGAILQQHFVEDTDLAKAEVEKVLSTIRRWREDAT